MISGLAIHRVLARRLAIFAVLLASIGTVGAIQASQASAQGGFEGNGGYYSNLYGHDQFGHDLDVISWNMGYCGWTLQYNWWGGYFYWQYSWCYY